MTFDGVLASQTLNESDRQMYLNCFNIKPCVSLWNADGRLTSLTVYGYQNLTTVPAFPFLTKLRLRGCRNLVQLPEFPCLNLLLIDDAMNLGCLPEYPRLRILWCYGCDNLLRLPEMPRLRVLDCSGCHRLADWPDFPSLRHINCFDSPMESLCSVKEGEVPPWMKPWQDEGLMPWTQASEGRGGYLVWKHVSPKCIGNMGFQYVVGQSFRNDGMACAGPFGAVRIYDLYRDESHLLAICANSLSPVNAQTGIYHVYEGTPLAMYHVTNQTEAGADLCLVQGAETPEIAALWE